jgi:transcriptional regulator with XRE-family HTH domain
MDIRKVMGVNARRYRNALDLSQEAVAVRMGADRAYVSAIERGIQNLTLLRLRELAEALDVSAADLLDEGYAATVLADGMQGGS